MIYLDHAASAPLRISARDAWVAAASEVGNASSVHGSGQAARRLLEDAREAVARRLGCEPIEVVFTGGGTEANALAIRGALAGRPDKRHFITTAVEHDSVLRLAEQLQKEGYRVTYLGVDTLGRLDMAELQASLDDETALVSVMHANNETGVVFPIDQLSRIVKETDPGIVFHTDATQTVGKLPIDMVRGFPYVDLLSFSGHKLHAPKGVGVLYLRRGTRMRPFLLGGHQEAGRRGGTENVPYIVGLGRAFSLATANAPGDEARIGRLRDRLERGLVERIPSVEINGGGAPRLPNTLNISFHFIEGEGMLFQLGEYGICASSGSACTSGSLEPSHVLRAMKVPFTAVHGSVRFSLSRYTTDAEIDRVLEVFPGIVANLRTLSPYWDNAVNAPHPDALGMLEAK